MYTVRISFNDGAADQVLDLGDVEREQAEAFAGELRHEVEQAAEIDAPVVEMAVPGGTSIALEPGRVVGIDLEDSEEA